MTLEISDGIVIVIVVVLCIVILALLLMVIYYRVEKHVKLKVMKEAENKKTKSQEMVRRLEKAGMKEKSAVMYKPQNMKGQKYKPSANNEVQIELEAMKKPSLALGGTGKAPGFTVTTTSRLRVLNDDEDPEFNANTHRLQLDDSFKWKHDLKKSTLRNNSDMPQLKLDESREAAKNGQGDQSMNRGDSKICNTMEDVRNMKVEDASIDIESLEKSVAKSPRLAPPMPDSFAVEFSSNNKDGNIFKFCANTMSPSDRHGLKVGRHL